MATSHENNIGGGAKNAVEDQVEGAQKAFTETRSDLSEKATGLADDAKEAADRKAEDAKQGLGSGLRALGGALRAAGDHLSQNGQSATSNLVGEAASGVDRFADSLENKPVGDVIEELRTLGRNNAAGLFAGSMLAGLALGRLLKSSGSADTSGDVQASPASSEVATPSHEAESASSNIRSPSTTSDYTP